MNSKDIYKQIRQVGILSVIPILLVTGPVVGYFTGSWLDVKTGKEPWFTAILVVLCCVASGKQVQKLIRMASKDNRDS